jgi:hypothetical protein
MERSRLDQVYVDARPRAPLEFYGELPYGLDRLLDALVQAAPRSEV